MCQTYDVSSIYLGETRLIDRKKDYALLGRIYIRASQSSVIYKRTYQKIISINNIYITKMSSKLPELYNTYLNQFPRYPHNNHKKKSDSKASKENDKLVKILNTKMNFS